MSNPFEYISREQEAKAQREKEAAIKAEDKRKQRERAFAESVQQYDSMVTSLLESLRDIAYPNAQVTKPDNPGYAWSIGEYWTQDVGDYGISSPISGFRSFVDIILDFSDNNKPLRFICRRNSYSRNTEVHCRLSENDLLDALKKLHPTGK